MRFPKLSDLDREQTRIYQGAPPQGSVLVVGPPGTGKSVIAFHRAHYLHRLNHKPQVIMYNKVLRRYTDDRGTVADGVQVSTLYKWAFSWWRSVAGRDPLPNSGGKWDHDWPAIRDRALQVAGTSGSGAQRINWGHLVIDEGQDFPPAMYGALKLVMEVANAQGAKPPLGITVMADENQRLAESRNSTIEEIKMQLGLHVGGENVFFLKKNYRNTKEIAEFAGMFYVGLPSGLPELPRRTGDRPVVSWIARDNHKKFLAACAEKIARYAKSRRTEEIAVIVMGNSDRKSMVNRLDAALDQSGVNVQTYASKDEEARAEDLTFDVPGHVTVLNYHSAKGLEFDAVFIIDPGQLGSFASSSSLHACMTMYVMCSRARSMLNVMLVQDENSRQLMTRVPEQAFRAEIL